ncbi:MAG: AAA family ATPase, partial [Methanomassiliicoccales archaeon]
MEFDPEAQGLLCFEEPENGIHPERIGAMLKLLKGLCVDPQDPVGADNPLRQVIVNTHSPAVVGLVDDDDLL